MLAKAALLVQSYDVMVLIAIALVGVATATAWVAANRQARAKGAVVTEARPGGWVAEGEAASR